MDVNVNIKNIDIKQRLFDIYKQTQPPTCDEFFPLVMQMNSILTSEDENIRPLSSHELPGGLIYLNKDLPTIIIPDLHARKEFLMQLLFYNDANHESIFNQLTDNSIQIVCVGDGMHSEYKTHERWTKAFKEFKHNYERHPHMDREMGDSFGLMEMIMLLKINFPQNFHFLKGNHENITNEEGNGNHPFIKFAMEGPMVLRYVSNFYGDDFLVEYANFEKNLPLLAIGDKYLISHSEPYQFYDKNDIIEYRDLPDVVYGLTWTDDDVANDGSVNEMLKYYLEKENSEGCYYFGGHRIVNELYNLRANNQYVQIHNPHKYIYVKIDPEQEIKIDEVVQELPSAGVDYRINNAANV